MDPPPPPPPDAVAATPAIRAIQRDEPRSLSVTGRAPGSLASVRSGRDLVKAADETVFVPAQLYAFLTSPEHTVTACLGNATVDMPVRIIAEYLFGLGYGSFGLWTGESPAAAANRESRDKDKDKEPALKSVKGWLGRLTGKPAKRGESPSRKKEVQSEAESRASDESDTEDGLFRAMRRLSTAEMNEVRRCGQWHGADPSDLFLNVCCYGGRSDARSTRRPCLPSRRTH